MRFFDSSHCKSFFLSLFGYRGCAAKAKKCAQVVCVFMCAAPFVVFSSVYHNIHVGLQALQQIRSLIPERETDQEFSVLVDQKAFAASIDAFASHPVKEGCIPVGSAIAPSRFYYSRVTLSGEPVRILDLYQEFEYGPYWRYPRAMERLYDMHHMSNGAAQQ